MLHRRIFLKKVALATGALYTPCIGEAISDTIYSKDTECTFQLGGKSLANVNSGSLSELISKGNSLLKLVSTDAIELETLIDLSPDAVLFGGNLQKKLSLEQAEALLPQIPLINSNFPNLGTIPSHRILWTNGIKTGVMGIGFSPGQNISKTIQQTIQKAEQLKYSLNCKRVVCITEEPASFGSLFTLQDLAKASKHIDSFFYSSNDTGQSKLYVLANQEQNQVLLHSHSMNEERLAYIIQKNNAFIDHKRI